MNMWSPVLLFPILFQVVMSKPRSNITCNDEPLVKIDPKSCCDIPQLINSDLIECAVHSREENNPQSCKQQTCVFHHYKLLNSDNKIDKKNFRALIDNWVKRHPLWKKAALKAKQRCLKGPIPITDDMCEPSKQIFCISGTLYEVCPKWKYTDSDCRILRRYMNECYYNFQSL